MKKRKILLKNKAEFVSWITWITDGVRINNGGFFWSTEEKKSIIKEEIPEELIEKKSKSKKVLDCSNCPLDHKPVFGSGTNTGWLWLGRDPGKEEVRRGRPFVGPSGMYMKDTYSSVVYSLRPSWTKYSLVKDAFIDNICKCKPKKNVFNKKAANHCYNILETYLLSNISNKPKMIVTVGKEATERILGHCNSIKAFSDVPVPSHKYKCIVYPILHPSYILRKGKHELADNDYKKSILGAIKIWDKIQRRPKYVAEFLKDRTLNFQIKEITTIDALKRVRDQIKNIKKCSIDFENNTAKVYTEGAELYLVALSVPYIMEHSRDKKIIGYWLKLHPMYQQWTESELDEIGEILVDIVNDENILKVIQNVKHEDNCFRRFYNTSIKNPVYCTMINKHILDSRKGITSLKNQVLQTYGVLYKHKTDPKLEVKSGEKINRIHEIPVEVLGERSAADAVFTLDLFDRQIKEYVDKKIPIKCMEFYAKSVRTFTNYEHRGIKIDLDKLKELTEKWSDKLSDIEKRIEEGAMVKEFKKYHCDRNNVEFNLNSYQQLRVLLFDKEYFNLSPLKYTDKTKSPSADQEVLEELAKEHEFCKMLIERNKIKNLLSTYLENIELYMGEDRRIHPDFWLHVAESFRSSSRKPNFQNYPKRYEVGDDISSKEVREIFIPSYPNWEFREVDYSGNEVKGLWMLSRDPQLQYDLNSGMDMHRFFAARLFKKPEDEVTKEERFTAKNKFVFASFYGASYKSIAESLNMDEKFVLKEHDYLFVNKYKKVRKWQFDTSSFYKQNGYVELLTRFRRIGPLDWNQIINTPIQGTAFHLLLNACNEVEDALERNNLETRALAQIHDSILFEGPIEERDEHIKLTDSIMKNPPFEWAKGVLIETEWQTGKNWGQMKDFEVKS